MSVSFSWSLSVTPASSSAASSVSDAVAAYVRDLAIDSVDGDLVLDGTGDLDVVRDVEAVASDLRSRLQTFAQEYFLDTSIGVPWLVTDGQYPAILGGKPNVPRNSEIFRAVITETPGVEELLEFSATADGRTLRVAFRCSTDTGAVIAAALLLNAGGN